MKRTLGFRRQQSANSGVQPEVNQDRRKFMRTLGIVAAAASLKLAGCDSMITTYPDFGYLDGETPCNSATPVTQCKPIQEVHDMIITVGERCVLTVGDILQYPDPESNPLESYYFKLDKIDGKQVTILIYDKADWDQAQANIKKCPLPLLELPVNLGKSERANLVVSDYSITVHNILGQQADVEVRKL